MTFELIAIGSELVRLGRPDTNGAWLADRLARAGHHVRSRAQVDDDVAEIAAVVRCALDRVDCALLTGGLGPTGDDRTRAAVASALDLPLERDASVVDRLRERSLRRGVAPSENQARQADRPRGATWIDNSLGSAPGFVVERGGRLLVALPGVPSEMRAMFADVLGRIGPGIRLAARRVFRFVGPRESELDATIGWLYEDPDVDVTLLAGSSELELHVEIVVDRGRTDTRRLDGIEERLRASPVGEALYGTDGDSLAGVVGRALAARGRTIAVAESCTAGLLAGELTRPPGSSAWFRGGLIVYTDDLKRELVGVGEADLRRHGAVSETVARQLAAGARRACRASIGVGVTGIAGPGGARPGKPVGRVHVAVDAEAVRRHAELRLAGGRDVVRARTVAAALDLVRRSVD